MNNRNGVLLRAGAATVFAALVVAGCDGGRSATDPQLAYTGGSPLVLPGPGNGTPAYETFEICKTGSDADFSYAVTDRLTGAAVRSGQVSLTDGECVVLALAGGNGQKVTVTELPKAGFQLTRVDVTSITTGGVLTNWTVAGPTVSDSVGGSPMGLRGVVATYVNEAIVPPPPTKVTLCKVGSAADFNVSVDGSNTAYSLGDTECVDVNTHQGGTPDQTVVLTETIPTNYSLDSIVVTGGPTYTGTNSATVTSGDAGDVVVTFYNRQIQLGQGCTPGYWKQPQHFDSWPAGYTPDMLFSAVFDDAFPGMTLLQVLSQGGGHLNALGRHTVAALLNGASGNVNYALTDTDVINAFNAAYPGTNTAYNRLKDRFATNNELGCPLN